MNTELGRRHLPSPATNERAAFDGTGASGEGAKVRTSHPSPVPLGFMCKEEIHSACHALGCECECHRIGWWAFVRKMK